MKRVVLDAQNLDIWASCFSAELIERLKKANEGENKHIYAMGIEFLGQPQGAVCWELQAEGAILHSIYIKPDFRRLGLGNELMTGLAEKLQEYSYGEMTVSYIQEGELQSLTPFLIQCGFEMEVASFPEGTVTLEQVNSGLLKGLHEKSNKYTCRPLNELTPDELQICREFMQDEMEMSIELYLNPQPVSFVAVSDNQLQGILLMRQKGEDLYLDYCWIRQGDSVTLVRLFINSMDSLNSHYAAETRIHMLLSTPQAGQLYHHLFGQPQRNSTFCSGTWQPQADELELLLRGDY